MSKFFRTGDLTIIRDGGDADDGRGYLAATLGSDETIVCSLLALHERAFVELPDGKTERVAFNDALPIVYAEHADASGRVLSVLKDGRQRLDSAEAINARARMVAALADDVASRAKVKTSAEWRLRTREEILRLRQAGDPAWAWAEPYLLPLYLGGDLSESDDLIFKVDGIVGLQEVGRAEPIEFVLWGVPPPVSGDPTTRKTALQSLALQFARRGSPPSVVASQLRRQVDAGMPKRLLAESLGMDRATVDNYLHLLSLEPEVVAAHDEGKISFRKLDGFFNPGSGTTRRTPKTPEEQRRLLSGGTAPAPKVASHAPEPHRAQAARDLSDRVSAECDGMVPAPGAVQTAEDRLVHGALELCAAALLHAAGDLSALERFAADWDVPHLRQAARRLRGL